MLQSGLLCTLSNANIIEASPPVEIFVLLRCDSAYVCSCLPMFRDSFQGLRNSLADPSSPRYRDDRLSRNVGTKMRCVKTRNNEGTNHTAAEASYLLQIMPEKLNENYVVFCTFSSVLSFAKMCTVIAMGMYE
jgi:hypothetical protein